MSEVKFPVFVDHQRRFAVQIDANPKYVRLLTLGPGGAIDVVKFLPYQMKRWTPYDVPNAAQQYVNTFARSTLSKTYRAVCAMEEVMQDLSKLSMPELVAEFNRLSGKDTKRFATKTAALKAIRKLTPIVNGTAEPQPAAVDPQDQPTAAKEQDMTAKTKKPAKKAATNTKPAKKAATNTKPAKKAKKAASSGDPVLDRAKKIAKMEKGSGGMIVQLLRSGKTDADAIVSAVLKKFPDRNVTNQQVSWYRSMMIKAGVLKA